MTTPSVILQIPPLDSTLGAQFIGCILSTAAWGISTAQLYWYFNTYHKDGVWLKTTVAMAWIFDTVQQMLICHTMYFYLITNWANPLILNYYVWSLSTQSLFEALTTVTVQGFFVYRIIKLIKDKSSWGYTSLIITCITLVLAKFGVGVAYVAIGIPLRNILEAKIKMFRVSETVNGMAAGADTFISLTMIWVLHGSRTEYKKTNSIISKLIAYTINTGALTSICAIVTLILAHTMEENYVYSVFYFLVAKIYVNSMLAMLNARHSISNKLNHATIDMNELQVSIYHTSQTNATETSGALHNTGAYKNNRHAKNSFFKQTSKTYIGDEVSSQQTSKIAEASSDHAV